MALFKCKMCGGTLEIDSGESIAICEYCETKQTIPTAQDEVLQGLFNRANILRIKSEFDKSEQLYEKIIQLDQHQSEAYWGLILCKYGIEYVEDPKTFKRMPTCHRTSFESIISNNDYKFALEYADEFQRAIYEAEAEEIDRLQKEILELSKKENPYDVFLCYKETDSSGKRTQDSVIANDIYHQLTQDGFKVFYAAITLEDKLGSAYEPYIFAALNSAKVMLCIGTKPEYYNAVWVKNEWSRFLKLMKNDRNKILIPCYRDMDAYELPDEFAHLQAQDMGKIGFINDIIRGIKKVVGSNDIVQPNLEDIYTANITVVPLLKRVFLFLEDEDYTTASDYAEKVLDLDPENPTAYWGILLASFQCSSDEKLFNRMVKDRMLLDNNKMYQKAIRFAGENSKYEEFNHKIKEHFQKLLSSYSEQIEHLNIDINKLENELSIVELSLRNLDIKKKDNEELEKQELASIDEQFNVEYQSYSKERTSLLHERFSLHFWNSKRKKEIEKRLNRTQQELEMYVQKKNRLKAEVRNKYNNIQEKIIADEKAAHSPSSEYGILKAQISEKQKLINELTLEVAQLSKLLGYNLK